MNDKGHIRDTRSLKTADNVGSTDAFVLEKGIFSNIFEKDIRRVYIYKKTERLAKAVHLITPAFAQSPALRNRIDAVAVGLIDAAILPPTSARTALSRELLALSSLLSIARSGSLISSMNAELISKEAHTLLTEIAGYEEPRLFMEEATTLAELFKSSAQLRTARALTSKSSESYTGAPALGNNLKDKKILIKDTGVKSGRREAVLEVVRSKGPSYIKDISTVIRDVSEKTIQRELGALVAEGVLEKRGERRWTTYSLI